VCGNRARQNPAMRIQSFSLPLGFRQAELFHGSRPFDCYGHQAANGIKRLAREPCSRNTEAPDGPHPEAHWNKVKALLRFDGHFIAEERGPSFSLHRDEKRHIRIDRIFSSGE